MAFNPFEAMRKRGKMILSIVTICIMFIFVLSSGLAGGDFFNDVIPRVFGGGGRNAGTAVAEGFGKKITGIEISQTQMSRRLANQFMYFAREVADTSRIRNISGKLDKLKEETRVLLKDPVEIRRKLYDTTLQDVSSKDRLAAQQAYIGVLGRELELAQLGEQFTFFKFREQLRRLDPEKNKEDYEAVSSVLTIMQRDIQRLRQQVQSNFQWPNESDQNAIDFILLKRKADKEGIQFPKQELDLLVTTDLGTTLSPEDSATAEKMLRSIDRFKSYRTSDLVTALADEYRVQTVLMANFRERPTPTPYEFFDFYQDTNKEISYSLVEIPVKNFIDQVKEQPTLDELKKLFDKYRTIEMNPSQPTPGFKDSRKIKLEFLTLNPKAKMYSESGPYIHAATKIAAGMMPVGGPAEGILTALAPEIAENQQVEAEVAKIRDADRNFNNWGDWSSSKVHDSSVYNPLPLAALAAQMLDPNNPTRFLNAGVCFTQQAYAIETRDRVKSGMPMALAGFSPNPIAPLAAVPVTAALLPAEPPSAVYAGPIRKKIQEQEIRQLFVNDVTAFMNRFNAYTNDLTSKTESGKFQKAKEAVIKNIVDFSVARGLLISSSTEAKDIFNIDKDPKLTPLVQKGPPLPGRLSGLQERFWFKRTQDPNSMQESRLVPITENDPTLFRPNWYPEQPIDELDKPAYVVWVTEDIPSKAYLNYDIAPEPIKKRVMDAWKTSKARDLAKKAADDLGAKVKELATKDLTGPDKVALFEDNLNAMIRPMNYNYKGELTLSIYKHQPGTGTNDLAGRYVQNYAIAPSTVEYPGDMSRTLLEARSKPVGETLVLNDLPVKSYYISTIVAQRLKTISEFSSIYKQSMKSTPDADMFYNQYFLQKWRSDNLRETMERLYAEANYKLDPKAAESRKKDPNQDLDN